MLLRNIKIQTRHCNSRHSKSKNTLKTKNSLPQNFSQARATFEHMKLTQSHEIQDALQNQFQLNIISPHQKTGSTQTVTKKFSCPEWIAVSQMKSSFQPGFSERILENPQSKASVNDEFHCEYQDSNSQSEETEEKTQNLMKIQENQTMRIMEISTNQNKQNLLKAQNLRISINFQDLQCKSAFIIQQHSSDSDKGSLTSLELDNVRNKSSVTCKAKSIVSLSRSIKSRQDLEEFHKEQFERLSEYGLKTYEGNRLKKIQEFQKQELLGGQKKVHFQEQNQEYFNISNGKKKGQMMNKLRKCSAVVEICPNPKSGKSVSKRSLSEQKHSLSKGKRLQLQSKNKIFATNQNLKKSSAGK